MQEELNVLLNKAMEDGILSKNEKGFINITVFQSSVTFRKTPGRPIISGINSLTCNLSHFSDLYLQDYVKALPSHLKDSDDLIRHLQKLHIREDFNLLTLDETALYSKHRPQPRLQVCQLLSRTGPRNSNKTKRIPDPRTEVHPEKKLFKV